jgi:hypothetical protein
MNAPNRGGWGLFCEETGVCQNFVAGIFGTRGTVAATEICQMDKNE